MLRKKGRVMIQVCWGKSFSLECIDHWPCKITFILLSWGVYVDNWPYKITFIEVKGWSKKFLLYLLVLLMRDFLSFCLFSCHFHEVITWTNFTLIIKIYEFSLYTSNSLLSFLAELFCGHKRANDGILARASIWRRD